MKKKHPISEARCSTMRGAMPASNPMYSGVVLIDNSLSMASIESYQSKQPHYTLGQMPASLLS